MDAAQVEQAPLIFTDDELTEQALAADPDAPLPDDATPFGARGATGSFVAGSLPAWYMPAASRTTRKPWHVALSVLSIAGFAAINAAGLCVTYGHLVAA